MEKTMMFEIQIPFAGFYYSLHDDQITREIEQLPDYFAEDMGDDMPLSLIEMFWDAANTSNAQSNYAEAYVEAFCEEYLEGPFEFAGMDSPKWYNYDTDRVFASISRATLARIWKGTDKAILNRLTNERHSHRSGFISSYSSDWKSWGRLSDWDHNQLGTLLLAFLETERGEEWDQWAEYSLVEDLSCNDQIHQWVWAGNEADRAWKIYNYLTYHRKDRCKTMAEWRVKYQKPWTDTPLGQYA